MAVPSFEIVILGSSSATPAYGRMPSAQVVNFRQRLFLIDCGEGTQLQLRKYHLSIQKIERIFISHLHGDHFFGIFGLLGSMQLLGRKKELILYAPPRLKDILDQIWKTSDASIQFPIEFIPLDFHEKKLIFFDDFLTVYAFPLKHRIPCYGFLFEEKPLPGNLIKRKIQQFRLLPFQYEELKKGKTVVLDNGTELRPEDYVSPPPPPRSYVYCSDTRFDENLAVFFSSPNLLYHEATFDSSGKDRAKATFHSTAEEAARMASLCGARKLIIGHFSARYKNVETLLREARSIFPNTMAATEGSIHPVT